MSETVKMQGPALTDERFFKECLDYEIEGLTETARYAANGDYPKARKAFADYVRGSLDPDTFFKIPYEKPENAYYLPGETEEDVCERMLKHVMVSCGIPLEFGRENEVDWMADPTGDTLKEWTWQLGRHHELKVLAHQYRKNPKPEYAKAAAELFTSWVRQAVVPGEDVPGDKTVCWRTIECGIRMGASWPYALHTFYRTPEFTDDVLVDWYKSVWEHGNRMQLNHWHGNWLIMEMNGLAQISILYPVFKKSKKWLDFAFGKLAEEIDRQFYPDGFQYELSTNYHDVVLNNYQRVMSVARAYGVTVPAKLLEPLEKACEIDVKFMMPDGTLPDTNDGCRTQSSVLLESKRGILSSAPEIDWVVSGRKEGREPEYKSLALPYSGFFIMRNSWGADATWALFDGGPFGRGHQHEDKLSLIVHAGGKLLVTEGGNYAYETSEMRKYVLSTRAHNTARVDGFGQNRRMEYRWEDSDIKKKANLVWNVGEKFDYAESSYDEAYGEPDDSLFRSGFYYDAPNGNERQDDGIRNVVHNRRVYFVKEAAAGRNPFFIVVDRFTSEETHEYEMLWHVNSENPVVSAYGVDTKDLNLCVSGTEKALKVIRGQEEPEWQGFVSTGGVQGMYEPVNCVSAVVKGNTLRVVTVLYPHVGMKSAILSVKAGSDPADEAVEIGYADGTMEVYHENEMKCK